MSSSDTRTKTSTPDLASVAANPDQVEKLPDEVLPDLLADVERLRARVWTRLNRPVNSTGNGDKTPSKRVEEDQLLDVESVAEILSVDTRYVYDHADEWPFTRRISSRKLRFSKKGLFRWLRNRP